MQTNLIPLFKESPAGQEAEEILRKCVHCGFCTATCPTYQELFDERDGPRGRIYLIKQILEGGPVTEKTRTHIDRCLTCRSCETTCPSSVNYGRLIDYGRQLIEELAPRPWHQQFVRWSLRKLLPKRTIFSTLLKTGQLFRPIMPAPIKDKIPPKQRLQKQWPKSSHNRVMLALAGCAQPGATPNTNIATANVLEKLGITLIEAPKAGCCGAVSYHLGAHDEGLDYMRRNIDAWWPAIESGVEAIVMTASGCGVMVTEYGDILASDPLYSEKAKRVSELTKDISEVLINEDLTKLHFKPDSKAIAFHCPCTLQHGMKLDGVVEEIFDKANIPMVNTQEKHLCCGSAGTYSILQPKLSQKLLARKLIALENNNPSEIVTANVGCQLHLSTKAKVPVRHWIELIDQGCSEQ